MGKFTRKFKRSFKRGSKKLVKGGKKTVNHIKKHGKKDLKKVHKGLKKTDKFLQKNAGKIKQVTKVVRNVTSDIPVVGNVAKAADMAAGGLKSVAKRSKKAQDQVKEARSVGKKTGSKKRVKKVTFEPEKMKGEE